MTNSCLAVNCTNHNFMIKKKVVISYFFQQRKVSPQNVCITALNQQDWHWLEPSNAFLFFINSFVNTPGKIKN